MLATGIVQVALAVKYCHCAPLLGTRSGNSKRQINLCRA
jgi:hypothetical protein